MTTSFINISSSSDENEEEINQISKVILDEQSIDIPPDDFKFLLDNFENDNGLLSEHNFIQIMKSNQIDNVFMFLEKEFSTEGLYKFCNFLPLMENIEDDILKSFCSKLLYPKVSFILCIIFLICFGLFSLVTYSLFAY